MYVRIKQNQTGELKQTPKAHNILNKNTAKTALNQDIYRNSLN